MMTRVWYGVVPTGAQAAVAIIVLSELFSCEYPSEVEVLSKDIYIYYVNPRAETKLERDEQISSTQSVLGRGWFGLNKWYIVEEFPERKLVLTGFT